MSENEKICPLRLIGAQDSFDHAVCLTDQCMWWCALDTEEGLVDGCSIEMLATTFCCDLDEIKKRLLG